MTCPCGSTSTVLADNYNTCTSCGLMFEYEPKYVQGYSTPYQHVRKQYYSRIKRFRKKLLDMKSDLIGENTEPILQLYGVLEFGWNISKDKKRKYFFSQKVVLYFLLKVLKINLAVPVLKNKDRTEEQLKRMCYIFESPGLTTAWMT